MHKQVFSTVMPKGIPDIVYSLGVFLMFLTVPYLNILYGTIVPFVLAAVMSAATARFSPSS